jgi:hypothetical protein
MIIIGGFCFRYTFMKAGLRAELPGEYETKYTDEELAALGHSLNARWIEKAAVTGGLTGAEHK